MSTYLQSAVGSRLFEHNDSTSSLSEHMSAIYETLPDVPEHIVYSSPDDLVSQIAPASGSGTLSSCEESTRISGPQPLRNNTIRIKRNRSRSPSVCSALSQTDVAGSGSSSGSFLTWPSSSSSFVPLRRCRSRASVIDPSSAVPAPSSSSVSPTPVIALTLAVPPQTTPATLSPFPSSPRSLSHLRLPSDASAASASTTTTATSSSTFASKSTAPSSTSVSTTCAPTYTYPSCLKQSHSRLGAKPTATAAVMAHAMVGKTMRRSASISTKNSTAKSVRFAEIPIVHTDVVWASESESSDDEDDNEGRKVSGILMRAGEEEEEEEGMEAVFGMHEGEEVEIQEIVEEPLEMERVEGQQVEEITEHGEEDEDDGADHDRVTDANTHANARRSKPSTSLTQTARTVKKWLLRTVTKPVSSSLSSLSSSSSSSSAPRRPTISGPLPLSGSSAPVAVGAVEKRASDTASLRSRSSSVASTSSRVSLPSSPRPLTIPASRTRLTLNLSIPGPYPLSAPSIYAHAHARTRLESDVSLASTSASVPSSALALSPRSPRPRRRGASFATGKSPVSPTPTPMSPTRLGTVPMVRSGSRNRCMASFGPSSPQEAVAKVVVGDAGP